eukprot:SAG11_NODE_31361_length_292_cov_1.067358_1_plen_20_part_01
MLNIADDYLSKLPPDYNMHT